MKNFLVLGSVFLGSFLPLVLLHGADKPNAEKPNIVWLISEDNSKHYLKLFDPAGAETPHIAALADHGLIFDHTFSNSPVCSVARTTLMTCCYGPRIGTQYHRRSVPVPLPNGLSMFPVYLREAGYYATNKHKTDYNAIPGKKVWDESSPKANWKNRKPNQPFFHMQSFTTSHESSLHFSEKVLNSEKTKNDPASMKLPPYHPDTPTFRYTHARYHDRIQKVDAEIGAVVNQLKQDGLLEDTFVFYFGDHGGVLPRSKGYIYESGLHVPLVIRVPEKWKHLVDAELKSRISGFVSFIDFGPTVLHLAGVAVPKQMDGKAFLGKTISMKQVNQRDETFGYADRFDAKYDLVRSLRKGNLKYLRNYEPFNFDGMQNNYRYQMLAYAEWRKLYQDEKLNSIQQQFFQPKQPEALYDLTSDPHETNNVAGDPKYAKQLLAMRNRLSEFVKQLPDLSFYPESYLIEHAFKNPTEFGEQHKAEIAQLVDVADLSLLSFADAKATIQTAIESENPWERYWGFIVCGSHGKAAESFTALAEKHANQDSERLVRVRAAEFLGLIGKGNPVDTINKALAESTSDVEVNLILNTVVMLQDSGTGLDFKLNLEHFQPAVRKSTIVKRRLEYLAP